MVKIKSSQKLFTEEEVSRLTGICQDHLHSLARSKHLGFIARAAEAAGEQAAAWRAASTWVSSPVPQKPPANKPRSGCSPTRT